MDIGTLLAVPMLAFTAMPTPTIWRVPSFGNVQAAVDAAAPGDVIELEAGPHFRFRLDKGLTIRGPGTIGRMIGGPVRALQVDVPPGQVARFVGITIAWDAFATSAFTLELADLLQIQSGSVVFEDCHISGSNDPSDPARQHPAIEIDDANVVFNRCTVDAFGSVIDAEDSNVSLVDFDVIQAAVRSPAVLIECRGSGSLHATGLRMDTNMRLGTAGFPAVGIRTTVDTWISDSTTSGVRGIGLVGTGRTFVARSAIVNVSGPVRARPDLLGITAASAMMRGLDFNLTVRAGGPAPITVFAVFDGIHDPVVLPGVVEQPLWTRSGVPFAAGFSSFASGEFHARLSVPNDPVLAHEHVEFVGARLGRATVELTPPIAAVIR